jgi:DNA-binding response OmpR family regulator
MLRRRGLDVVVATDAAAAVRVAIKEIPSAIVLDIGLPGGEGTRVLGHLRALPRLAGIPVIMLSGRDPEQYREASLSAGALVYLTKPVDENELVAALELALPDWESTEPGAATSPVPADLKGKSILLVDDDEDFLMVMSAMLRRHGMHVIVATDGITATSIAVKQRPDMIVLDIGLPGGEGTLVMKRLHGLPQLAAVPMVILSGRDPAKHREAALAAGAAAYLTKPVDEQTLLDALALALAGHGAAGPATH